MVTLYTVWETPTYGYVHDESDGSQIGFIFVREGKIHIEWLP